MPKCYAKIESSAVTDIAVYDADPGSPWVAAGDNCTAGEVVAWDTVSLGAAYDSSESGSAAFTAAAPDQDANYDKAVKLLGESDWTQLNDTGLTSSNKTEWQTYRASLRAIAKNPTAGNKTWPTKPDEEYT